MQGINILLIFLFLFISTTILCQSKDSIVYYNNMQKKVVISNKTIYSYYNKEGKLILKYDYANDRVLIDSIDKSLVFYTLEMDSIALKSKYDIPPTVILAECYQLPYIRVHYPAKAIEDNLQGDVIIKVHIDRFGSVTKYSTIKSVADYVDIGCIKQLKILSKCWVPAIKNGKTVESDVEFSFHFKLDK